MNDWKNMAPRLYKSSDAHNNVCAGLFRISNLYDVCVCCMVGVFDRWWLMVVMVKFLKMIIGRFGVEFFRRIFFLLDYDFVDVKIDFKFH